MDEDDLIEELLSGDVDILGASAGVRQGPLSVEGMIVGIPIVSVGANASATVKVEVTQPFRARRMILSAAAQALNVDDIKVSNVSQFMNSSPVSGEVFAADAVGAFLRGDTARPGVGIEIKFSNPTGGAVSTGGGIYGEAATPG